MKTVTKREEIKKQWKKPVAKNLDIASITKGGMRPCICENCFNFSSHPVS